MGFDPESKRCNGRENKQIGDEHLTLQIKRSAEKVSKYDCGKSKEAK